jgi:hypothetical protein
MRLFAAWGVISRSRQRARSIYQIMAIFQDKSGIKNAYLKVFSQAQAKASSPLVKTGNTGG